MLQAEIKVDLGASKKAADILRRGFGVYNLTETHAAIEAGAQAIQSEWTKYVSGATVVYSGGTFTIKRVSGQYANAVMGGLRYPMDGNPLKGGVEVILDYAEKLERGYDAYDEKPGLLRSPKVKWTSGPDEKHPDRQSQPYIDVPFEHAEQSIPRAIKNEVKKDGRSLGLIRLGTGLGSAPAGLRSNTAPEKLGLTPYTWRAGVFTGMVRGQAGPEARGKYMTFRRVSLASDPSSWINPGVSPKPVTKAIKENIGAKLAAMVSSAFERDVLRLSRLAGLT
jgi:hypothetical protein